MKIYKVTAASTDETKQGFGVFKLQLNNTTWVTKLIPLNKRDRKYDALYNQYTVKNNLEFIIGKYISISFKQTQYGHEFTSINSFDVLSDFKTELRHARGSAFTSSLPIYDFLINIKRNVEPDGSIKVKSDFPDIRVTKLYGSDVCYQFNNNKIMLTPNNIIMIFEQFYKDVTLPSKNGDLDSYYRISRTHAAIVKMNHRVKLSYKMTHSGDFVGWEPEVIVKIGEELPDNHAQFLKENFNKTVEFNKKYFVVTDQPYKSGFYRFTVEDTYNIDNQLLSELIRLRRKIALDNDTLPFIIFKDSVIKEMAHKKPCNILELSKIKSFSKPKLDCYGQEIINLIRKHVQENTLKRIELNQKST
ncbi:MAG: HRDC domain-containing protein [Cognaticolwellia sp.]